MTQPSLKNQTEHAIESVAHDLEAVESQPADVQTMVDERANAIAQTIFNVVSDVDIAAATARMAALKKQYPNLSAQELAQKVIAAKCQKTGTVGAVTAGAGIIPGIGTAAALTLGTAADIGVTFKMQAELVLEIAALYDYPLSEDEKQRLVMVISGISAGTTVLARRAGQNIALKAGEHFAGRAFLRAIPVVGVLASAGTNVLSTYIIGQRADAYFRLGPEAVGSWADSLRTISGMDERRIGGWLAESGTAAGSMIATGAGKVGEAGKTASAMIVSGAGQVAGTVGPAVTSGATTARRGTYAYLGFVKRFWLAAFRFVKNALLLVWRGVTFVPRKIAGLFRRRKNTG